MTISPARSGLWLCLLASALAGNHGRAPYSPATQVQAAKATVVYGDKALHGDGEQYHLCHAGTYAHYDMAHKSLSCAKCPAGQFGELDETYLIKGLRAGGVCKFCPAGKYQWQEAQTDCLDLPDAPEPAPAPAPAPEPAPHTAEASGGLNYHGKGTKQWWQWEGLNTKCARPDGSACDECAYDEIKHKAVCKEDVTDTSTYPSGRVYRTEAADAKFDDRGRYLPPRHVDYDVSKAKQCCMSKCAGPQFADCHIGCKLWMHHSSLNWESAEWHPLLRNKCASDCSQGRRWQGSLQDWPSVYTTRRLRPEHETLCRLGCNNYLTCMGLTTTPVTADDEAVTAQQFPQP